MTEHDREHGDPERGVPPRARRPDFPARDVLGRASLLETRFRDWLEAAPDATVVVDADGRILLVNSQLLELFGYAREDLLGRPVELLVPERLRDRHLGQRAAYRNRPHRRPIGAGLDLFARRADGTEFPVDISLNPMASEAGPVVIAAVRDITERRALEQKRREADELAMRRAQEASRLKSELVAKMSHELRTPLNAVIGFAQLLRDGKAGELTSVQREFVGDILASANHLLRIVDDALDLAKLDAGRLEFRPATVDPASLIAAAAPGHVLVVDDSPVNLKLVRVLLEEEGHAVRTADSAEAALRALREAPPGLVLMDVQLPSLDGLELTRRLKSDPATRAIPVVAVTAYGTKADEQRALAAGCDGYLSKPIDTRRLLELVSRWLGPRGGR